MGLDMYLIKRKKGIEGDYWGFKDELIYWRKANMIHKFFCDNGEEINEQEIYKISKEVLEDLLEKCKKISSIARLKEGKIKNGYTFENGEMVPILEDGRYIENSDEVESILPTQAGFFFGSTEYDEWYLEDIERTKEELENIINQIDFDNEECYYLASW